MERPDDPNRAPPPDYARPLRVADLRPGAAHDFDLTPDAAARQRLAADLGIDAVRKLRFTGRIAPSGRRDWRLSARLGATVVQPCVVTLAPVTTRIETEVARLYLADMPAPPPGETEMPEDDSVEPLSEIVDPGLVMAEALALALPLYPRAEGAALDRADFAAPGTRPLSEDDVKPFAGLRALRDRLKDGQDGDPEAD